MIGACLFLGWCTTLLWLPPLSDKHGRKWFVWAGQVIDLALYTGLMLTSNLIVMIFLWVGFGAMSTLRIQIAYIYLMEL